MTNIYYLFFLLAMSFSGAAWAVGDSEGNFEVQDQELTPEPKSYEENLVSDPHSTGTVVDSENNYRDNNSTTITSPSIPKSMEGLELKGFEHLFSNIPRGYNYLAPLQIQAQKCALDVGQLGNVIAAMKKSGTPVEKVSLRHREHPSLAIMGFGSESTVEYNPKDRSLTIIVGLEHWVTIESFTHGKSKYKKVICGDSKKYEAPSKLTDGRIRISKENALSDWRDYVLKNAGTGLFQNLKR